MKRLALMTDLAVVFLAAISLAACGESGISARTTANNEPAPPAITLTPATNSLTLADPLSAKITVTGTSSPPTGVVTLTSGSYVSSSTPLQGGSATITIPAGKLSSGSHTIAATYTPDSASSAAYTSAIGTTVVAVTVATPAMTLTAASSSIGTGQPLSLAVALAAFPGGAIPTGNVTLTSANYSSTAPLDNSGTASIVVPAGMLPAGIDTLTASYSPDPASAGIYASASKTAKVTVIAEPTPTVTVTPASQSITADQSLQVALKVNPAAGNTTPTGSVVLSSGAYHSASAILSAGSAGITMPGYALVSGSATLTAAYTPDAQSAGTYTSGAGTAQVRVARVTPAITVTPAGNSTDTSQNLSVTIAVAGPSTGAPVATGSVMLSSGRYTSSAATLAGGSAAITIPAGQLASGSNTLTAAYTPDTAGATLFNPATGVSPTITVVVFSTITINQSTSLAPVTDQLMGMNLAAWYDVVGNAVPINTAFGKAGIKAIRWPGGSWSDIYHWGQGGVAPFKCIVDPTDPTGTNWAGYSSFSQFVTSIAMGGSYDLALTANYGTNAACNGGGDPAEAAGWVAEAVSEGYAPSHVTVGNENYGNWEFDLHTAKNDPKTYANSVIGSSGYYKRITTANPATKVGVVVDANCTPVNGCTANWDSTVLSLAKGSYDFVEFHFYPQAGNVTSDTYLVHQAALDFSTNINTIKNELAAAGEANTPIYVGEVGANAGDPGTQGWSITQGLYAGQLLGEAMNDGIARLTWWIGLGNCLGAGNNSPSLYGWQNTWGAYNVFSDADPKCPGEGVIGTMSPTAQAFNLFQNIAVTGESALGTTFSGDSTNIRAYAATHSGGTALFLFNLNPSQSQPVQIKLSGGSASSPDVQVITYDKAIYDQTNAATPVWAAPQSTDMGAQNLPLTLSLTPWSMNIVLIK